MFKFCIVNLDRKITKNKKNQRKDFVSVNLDRKITKNKKNQRKDFISFIFLLRILWRFITVKITKARKESHLHAFAFENAPRIGQIEHRLVFQECNYELLGNVNLIKHPSRFTPGRIFLAGVARCPGLLTSRPSRRLIKLNVRFPAGSPSPRVNEPRFRFSRQIGGKSFNGNKRFHPSPSLFLQKGTNFVILCRDSKRNFRRDG